MTFEGLGEHAFEDDRRAAGGSHPFDRDVYQGASVLVAGANFGCGSSREHAPQSLVRWGIRGLVGESFAEIFFGNCVALGVPCLVLPADEIDALQSAVEADPTVQIKLDLGAKTVKYGDRTVPASLPDGVQQAFLSGGWDSTAHLLEEPAAVDAVAAGLPYVSGWSGSPAES